MADEDLSQLSDTELQARVASAPEMAPRVWHHKDVEPNSDEGQHRVQSLLATHAIAGRPWQHTAENIMRSFPSVDPGEYRSAYQELGQGLKLDQAREKYKGLEETTGSWLKRRAIPFVSTVLNVNAAREYAAATKRYADHKPNTEDADTIANYEKVQQEDRDGSSTFGGGLKSAAAHIPALVGEAYGGGYFLRAAGIGATAASQAAAQVSKTAIPILSTQAALAAARAAPGYALKTAAQTAVIPSMYAEKWVQNNIAAGRDPLAVRGFAPAFAGGMLQTAILGQVGNWAAGKLPQEGIAAFLGRQGIKGAAGTAESAAADVLAGAAGLDAHYGTIQELLTEGQRESGLKHALITALTFTALGTVHEGMHGTPQMQQEALKPYLDTLKKMRESGLSPEAAGNALSAVSDRLVGFLRDNPNPSKEEVQQAMKGLPEGPQKQWGEILANTLPRFEETGSAETHLPGAEVTDADVAQAKAGLPDGVADEPLESRAAKLTPQSPQVIKQRDELLKGTGQLVGEMTGDKPSPLPEPTPEQRKAWQGYQPLPVGELKKTPPARPSPEVERAALAGKESAEGLPPRDDAWMNAREKAKRDNEVRKLMGLPPLPPTEAERAGEAEKARVLREASRPPEQGPYEAPESSRLLEDRSPPPSSRLLGYKPAEPAERSPEDKLLLRLADEKHSLRAIGHILGLSHTTVRNKLKKLGWESPSDVDKPPTLEELKKSPAPTDAIGLYGEPPAREAIKRGREAIDAVHEDLDLADEKLKDIAENERMDQALIKEYNDAAEAASRSGHSTASIEESTRGGEEAGAPSQYPAQEGQEPARRRSWRDWLAERGQRKAAQPAAEGSGESVPGAAEQAANPAAQLKEQQAESLVKKGVDRTIQALKDLYGLEDGFAPIPAVVNNFVLGLRDKLVSAVKHVGFELAELSGKMFPRTASKSKEAADAVTHVAVASDYVRQAAPEMIDRVMGKSATPEQRLEIGTAMAEERTRRERLRCLKESRESSNAAGYARAQAQATLDPQEKSRLLQAAADEARRATEYQHKARGVKTFVGDPDYPLPDEATLRKIWASPGYKEARKGWQDNVVPFMEENYRAAQGLDDTDPIDSKTQIPDLPMNFKVGMPGQSHQLQAGPGRGNLKAPKQPQYQFAREAGLDADKYDTDIGAMIENSMGAYKGAMKARMYRTLVEQGLAQWGNSKDGYTDPSGVVYKELPGVKPPKGTQTAAEGETSLYVHPDSYNDVRRALQVDQPLEPGTVRAFNGALTTAALASTVEMASHGKNLLTFLFKPGVNPVDVISEGRKLMAKDPATMKRLSELARIGALKAHGLESEPSALSRYNPLKYGGEVLDFLQQTMRLVGENAYDRLVKQGRETYSETGKRDFINQLGQYNKAGQQKYVALLRDTGWGLFATAGTNYYMQGLGSLYGDPGLKGSSTAHRVGLHAEVLGRIALVAGSAALANYLAHGRVDGSDDTPLGAIKLGESNGKTIYYDLTNLTGLTRGMRATGLLALTEGLRRGDTAGQIGDRAFRNAWQSALHPAEGPAVSFIHTALSGENTLGQKISKKAMPGEGQSIKDITAALLAANPVIGQIAGVDNPKGEKQELSSFYKLLGPFGPKEKGKPEEKAEPSEADFEEKIERRRLGSELRQRQLERQSLK